MGKKYLGGVFLVVLFGFILGHFFLENTVLLTTDAAISGANLSRSEVFHRMLPAWIDTRLLGSPGGRGTQIAHLLKAVINGVVWNNVIYGFACLLASLAFLLKFRRLNLWVVVLGSVTAFWLGNNFSTIYGGHSFKPYVTFFFVCSLIPVASAAAGSILYALIWGGCVGLMFAQQPDVALFYALFSGAYLVFRLWKAQGFRLIKWLKVMLPAAALAFLFAGGPLLYGYTHAVKESVQMQTQDDGAKWSYITQWSLPPDEVVNFVAPGYMGWRSGEVEGPYWGRIGRSDDWERNHVGLQNFKLDGCYYGVIPFIFALFALFSCWRSAYRAEVLFWSGAALVALLLAFGKFFPLYSLFFKLPVVNAVRSPIKFLQPFQVILAILSVYGGHMLFSSRPTATDTGDEQVSSAMHVRRFFWICLSIFVVFLLATGSLFLNQAGDITAFVEAGWPKESAEVMARNKVSSLWHATFMISVVSMVFGLFSFPRFEKVLRHRNWLGAGLAVLVAADAVSYSKHYVTEMPRSYIVANPLTDFLKSNLGNQRVALLSQQGINNIWITYLLPYNRIPCFNFSDMPRMAHDYKAFLTAGQRDPLGMWRFSSVKYLLGPAKAEMQLQAANCKKVFAYGLVGSGDGEFDVVPHVNGSFAVYELLGTMPRYALIAGSRRSSDEQALKKMADFNQVVLTEDSGFPELKGTGHTGSVEILSYRSGEVTLRVRTDVPAILRAADRYDAEWKARLNGKPVAVERVDFICNGIYVPVGEHEVVLKYSEGWLHVYMQLAGLVILVAAMVVALKKRKSGHVED